MPDSPQSPRTSMLLSGDPSLPALEHGSSSSAVSGGGDGDGDGDSNTPGTPPDFEGVPAAAPMTAQLQRLRAPAVLECPFHELQCRRRFSVFNEWLHHSLEHFIGDVEPPRNGRCVFCRRAFSSASGMQTWHDKLVCTAHHHVRQGARLEHASPDHALHRYLWEKRCITPAQWKDLMKLRADDGPARGGPQMSPPASPVAERSDQENMVMVSNTRADREKQRRERRIRELEQLVGDESDAAQNDN